jgi:predicted AlkP superfamily pyrophosphatase or phosphodiesterase
VILTGLSIRAAAWVLLAGAGLAACGAERRTSPPVPKTVFVIVDGIPADVLEHTPTPAIDAIAAAGGYTRAYVGGVRGTPTESPTVSAVGYMSLLTGTWSNKHNVRDNKVEAPDYRYWDIFRIARAHDPALRTAVFSTWLDNRTKLLGDGLEAAGGRKIDHHVDGLELDTTRFPHDDASRFIADIDTVVASEAARHVREHGPDLTWVYLQHTDDVAHDFGDSAEFGAAVEQMDRRVGAIWSAVRARQDQQREDWLMLVTTDHGRDPQSGRTHGQQSDRERTIWIAANSRHLNAHFRDTPAVVDILPSIAAHMRFTVPDAVRRQFDGRPFIDRRE